MSWFEGTRARLRLLFARRATESRMDEEIRFHVEMETERLVRDAALNPREARRRALVAFGGVEKHKESLRDGRGLAWLGGLSLDLKLGFRMLVKYPGLTLVGGLAMAFAIWAGAVTFVLVGLFISPTLPLPGGDRIVQIRNWDVAANGAEPRALHDFVVWRDALRSVTDLGASPRRVVAAIFRKPLTQVGLGVVAGGALIAVGAFVLSGGDGQLVTALSPGQLGLLAVYAALMFGVCLLACIVPTQRALRVEPTEALRAE